MEEQVDNGRLSVRSKRQVRVRRVMAGTMPNRTEVPSVLEWDLNDLDISRDVTSSFSFQGYTFVIQLEPASK
jgi:hypothetical protein